ncbi:MAG TPA: HD domain-containing phosphohydrolase [Longimicrobium sp.]|nr:HD domain-containing phosphohydrolase [Longimicrobium sp.]
MLSGRILIVSDRPELVAELEPMLRGDGHLAITVTTCDEALEMLERGLVPDVVVTDLGSRGALLGLEYAETFRELNRAGRHLVVVDREMPQAPLLRGSARDRLGPVTPLLRPFRPAQVQMVVAHAVEQVDAELRSLRGEMWRELGRMRQAMRDLRREAVGALAATIAARDPYAHGHTARVTELCASIARALGVGEADLEVMENAATLHEIGKISVPLELLHKTAPLTPEELERIRSHAALGAEIVRGVAALARAAAVIEHQGTDYTELPRHLDAEGPEFLLASILRVADAYDAMLSQRSYRGPLPREYWETALRAGAGSHFHPDAVDALLRVVGAAPEAARAEVIALRPAVRIS